MTNQLQISKLASVEPSISSVSLSSPSHLALSSFSIELLVVSFLHYCKDHT
jgi:hypothetical protein